MQGITDKPFAVRLLVAALTLSAIAANGQVQPHPADARWDDVLEANAGGLDEARAALDKREYKRAVLAMREVAERVRQQAAGAEGAV
ncbi:MAG TPA: hypothetical protein VFP39_04285, partial [Gemmatimonadales bacterium]|nr:hypothetical protein [Gemmatimonadales bacterium]